ncbi:MAG: tetratricopeptide repeat protein [Longimicrobiales bacterium]
MIRRSILVLLALGTATTAEAQTLTGAARWADSARRAIEPAYLAGDTTALAEVRVLLERALTTYPNDALLLHYQGYVDYRDLSLRMGRWRQDVGQLLDEAERSLEASSEAKAMPETFALLSSVIGQKIGSNPLRGMTLGPRSSRLMERALEAGPNNPRVWLLRGIGAKFTPKMFGGGAERAEEYLERAAALFENDAPPPPLPAWGKGEVWAWLGQVYAEDGRGQEARTAYMKALQLEPDNGWVRDVLLPGLDRKQ